ncbi:hypothetical protein [Pseudoxanthomonas winnipegensis]|uniref:Lipoprotein n=1 Tax=Pseudoxanthomonas winnipegensis TaxID=2480810 RepID=A0A4Q8M688_9GAMM|nr:hypothetical protein [Pseudoxanthomonas winnipegensis]TAA45565.1 hypothetical protein EA655_05065 [Pseudoxanthomonas winnipegensis]
MSALLLALCGCARDSAPDSIDDPRLKNPLQLGNAHALSMDLLPGQQAMLDPQARPADAATPLAIAGASRVGADLVIARLREVKPGDAPAGDAYEWTYAVDCRDGRARLLGAGRGIGNGLPAASGEIGADGVVPAATERRRALDLVCRYRTRCELRLRDNPCERSVAALPGA